MILTPGPGERQRSVVTEPARQPMNTTRSAALTTARVSGRSPLEPTTPRHRGWVSGRLPWQLTVVATVTNSPSASNSRNRSAPASTTPPPQMITGRSASRIAASTFFTSSGSGDALSAGNVPNCASAQISSFGTTVFCTSKGRQRCAAPGRPVVISRNARRTERGRVAALLKVPFHLVSD